MEFLKRQLNLKVDEVTAKTIERASLLMKKTKAQVLQEAVADFGIKHKLLTRYKLHIQAGMLVLMKMEADTAEIVEMEKLNGTPPDIIAQRYSVRFHQPVPIVEVKEGP